MSNAIAQSATDKAVSTSGQVSYDFDVRIVAIAQRKLPTNGLTVTSVTVQRSKLISALCADYRSFFPGMFGKRDDKGNMIPESVRLPEEIYTKVTTAVDSFIQKQFDDMLSNPDELVKRTRRFTHLSGKKDVVMRHNIQRDEILPFKERILGIKLFIGESNRLLDSYNEQKSVWSEATIEKVKKLEKRLANETNTLNRLEEEQAKQSAVTAK